MIPHAGIFFYSSKALANSNYGAYTIIHSSYEIVTITLKNNLSF